MARSTGNVSCDGFVCETVDSPSQRIFKEPSRTAAPSTRPEGWIVRHGSVGPVRTQLSLVLSFDFRKREGQRQENSGQSEGDDSKMGIASLRTSAALRFALTGAALSGVR